MMRRTRLAGAVLEQFGQAHGRQGLAQLVAGPQPDLVHGAEGLLAAAARPDDAVVQVDFADHGFNDLEQRNVGRVPGQNEAAVGALLDLDEARLGELLGDLGEEVGRNVRAVGDLLPVGQDAPPLPAQVQHAADGVFSGTGQSHGLSEQMEVKG